MMQLPRARSLAPTRLSRLPPEIWDQILDVATHVPYSLAPEILERSSLIGHPYNSECRAALWSALLTKGTIVRVCKQWWHIAIRYLYRAIYIRGTHDVLSLRRTLQKYAEGNGTVTEVEPLGWWTQRVDIVFDDTCTGVDEEALADIFKFLPNVAVFSGTFSNADSITYLQPTVHALLVGCASSLRVLDWSASDDNVPEARILRRFEGLVKDLPQLHTLNFPGLLQWPNGTITNSTLTSIHTLCLRDLVGTIRFREQERRSLLNLRELVLYPPPRWEEPSWRNFLHHYGPYLTSVQLRAISNPGLISVYLPVVNQTCPNLRRLTLFVLSFSDISTSDILAFDTPPIEYLGLSVRRLQCRSMYEILFSALAILKAGLPTLHVVQLLDRQTVEDLLKYNLPLVSQAVEEGLIGNAFRLEDHDGNSLSGE
ncbi:hypothetical protein EDC04DRAFT_2090701 [Pisolithus marmoratus]|nr:hypothetical protein EDC04DRAFT_2090701 [Pisolithus marmoratus]